VDAEAEGSDQFREREPRWLQREWPEDTEWGAWDADRVVRRPPHGPAVGQPQPGIDPDGIPGPVDDWRRWRADAREQSRRRHPARFDPVREGCLDGPAESVAPEPGRGDRQRAAEQWTIHHPARRARGVSTRCIWCRRDVPAKHLPAPVGAGYYRPPFVFHPRCRRRSERFLAVAFLRSTPRLVREEAGRVAGLAAGGVEAVVPAVVGPWRDAVAAVRRGWPHLRGVVVDYGEAAARTGWW